MEQAPPSSTDPFDPAPPIQLTYNPLPDGEPAILSGNQFIYSFVKDTAEHDRCLGVLPLSGGTRARDICARTATSLDSTDTYRWPAVLGNTTLIWFRASRTIGSDFDREAALVTSSLADPDQYQVLLSFPARSNTDELHLEPASLRPIGDGRLAYVAMRFFQDLVCDPSGCDNALFFSGGEVALVDPAQPGAAPVSVEGTTYASSVSGGPSAGDIIYTLAGDSRVYQRLASGAVTVVHDFGGSGYARDVQLVGGRLVAVVGGLVATRRNSFGETIQIDGGGVLTLVNLANGAEVVVGGPTVRHPALTPDGRQVVAEFQGNLYRYDLP